MQVAEMAQKMQKKMWCDQLLISVSSFMVLGVCMAFVQHLSWCQSARQKKKEEKKKCDVLRDFHALLF